MFPKERYDSDDVFSFAESMDATSDRSGDANEENQGREGLKKGRMFGLPATSVSPPRPPSPPTILGRYN